MTALRVVQGGQTPATLRTPACELGAEDALVGLFLCGVVSPRVVEDVLTTDEIFFSEPNRRIWRAILAASKASDHYDLVAVCSALHEQGDDSLMPKARALLEAAQEVTSERRARSYAQTIRNRWLQRRLGWAAERIMAKAYQPTRTPYTLIDEALEEVRKIEADTIADASVVTSAECLKDVARRLAAGSTVGLSTGISEVDELTKGLHPKEVTIVAARTSVGKSMLTGQIACAIAKAGHAVLYVTLEMTPVTLTARMLSHLSAVHHGHIQDGTLTEAEWGRVHLASSTVHALPIQYNASTSMTMLDIARAADGYAKGLATTGRALALIVVDHIGLVRAPEALLRKNREEQVADTSRKLRSLAEEFRCPVVALAQINRESEKRQGADRIPKLHEIRDSGSIEQDADSVLILHRARDAKGVFARDVAAELVVAKARTRGKTGHLFLKCEPEFMRFSPWGGHP